MTQDLHFCLCTRLSRDLADRSVIKLEA